jgi:hypothetical protein
MSKDESVRRSDESDRSTWAVAEEGADRHRQRRIDGYGLARRSGGIVNAAVGVHDLYRLLVR